MEKRIDGAKLISEVCKHANQLCFSATLENNHRTAQERAQTEAFVTEVIQKIKEGAVLNQMFSKDRGHLQMVERAEELLKLLISQDALNEDELEMIWSATKLDETT